MQRYLIAVCSFFFFISSFFFHILSYLLLSSPLPKTDTTSVEEGQNVFQMIFSWQLVCPLISLALFDLSRHVRDKRGLSSSPLNFCLSFATSACQKTPCSHYPCASASFHPSIISSFVSFHQHDPHLKKHGMACCGALHENTSVRMSCEGHAAGACYNS